METVSRGGVTFFQHLKPTLNVQSGSIGLFMWESGLDWLILVFPTKIWAPGAKISQMNTSARLVGRNVFDKIASLSKQKGQHGISISDMWIIFVIKVTGADKATKVANDTMFLIHFDFVLSRSNGLKFLIRREEKLRPAW